MRENKLRIKTIIISMLMVVCLNVYGQKTYTIERLNKEVKQANDNFSDKNYAIAYDEYSMLINNKITIANGKYLVENQEYDASELYFNRALCAYYLMNKDVDCLFKEYIKLFPSSNKISRAYFYTANYYMLQTDYLMALNTYKSLDETTLSENERMEYYYKIGYCYFLSNNNQNAKSSFERVKETDSKYAPPSKYYYGHILYSEGSYRLALKEFEDLKNDKKFGKIVPYYICQIYYFQENYPKIIEIAPTLSDNAINSKRSTELNRMIGDAYYKMGQYEEAIPYLEKAIKESDASIKEDNYLLGYCLMKKEDYSQAIPYLKKATIDNDTIAQNAMYNLGFCNLHVGDSIAAQSYFKGASEMSFDKKIQQDALYSYCKLCVNQPSPYNEAIKGFQTYIKKYPKADNIDDAKGYLVQLYARTKNYKDALVLIEKMKNRNEDMNKVYQRVCLNRGIEVFNEKKYSSAINLFDKSVKQPYDNNLTASAYYLKAESYYRMKKYEKSVECLNTFYSVPDYQNSEYSNMADYSMGYNLFQQKKYALAKNYFKRVAENKRDINENTRLDSRTRLGDCYFMSKEYNEAIEQYTNVQKQDKINADYALYQKAIILGLENKDKEKIATLQQGISKYDNSSYSAAMRYALANTYLSMEDNDKAIKEYKSLVNKYPNSVYTRQSYGKIGMIQYKTGKNEEALKTLDYLVKTYPNTAESKSALLTIKNIYMEKNDVDEFFSYVKTIPEGRVSKTEQDSILYQTAENNYMDGKYDLASKGFEKYLDKFPQGIFNVKATYYLAGCLMENNDTAKSAQYYEMVAFKPKNIYTEKSIINSASYYQDKDIQKTIALYSRLDSISESQQNKLIAEVGLMNGYYKTKEYNKAIDYSNRVLNEDKINEETKDNANYIIAKSYFDMDSLDSSEIYFNKTKKSTNGLYSGESNYMLANIAYNKKLLDKSEKIIKEYSKSPTNEYFLAKSYILWADIFVSRGNDFQAKQTLKSIIDNYDGKELVDLAQQKLDALNDKSNKAKQMNEQEKQKQANQVDEVIIEDKK
ncbi:MAG: tetratricopeptide repeat protein [Bacteroidales bacterium]|jgi:TolA-binding protein|nr:tetratricopeptide repeat protein [Bacteroidales bacterium]